MTRFCVLTPSKIGDLKTGSLRDAQTAGLSIEMKRDKPTWLFRRRVLGSNVEFKRTLGPFPLHSIGAARAWASQFNVQIEAGIDPRNAERDIMDQAKLTVSKAHEIYMVAVSEGRASRAKRRNRPRTIIAKVEIFRSLIAPTIGDKSIFDVTESDLTKLVVRTGKRAKTLANRLICELKVFFGWASSLRGTEIGLPINPAARLADLRFPENSRSRILSLEEIGLFLQALLLEPRSYQRGMLLWLLTAARLSEVAEARRTEFDFGVWTIPKERTKNGRAHRIALGPWGQSLFQSDTAWLFPSERIDGPRIKGTWYQSKRRIIAEMSRLAGRPIENWTLHDLRRTARSNTKRLNVDFETAEAMLNHVKTGLERTYDVYALDEEKRDWFHRWEREIVRIATNVGAADALGVPGAQAKTSFNLPTTLRWKRPTRARAFPAKLVLQRA